MKMSKSDVDKCTAAHSNCKIAAQLIWIFHNQIWLIQIETGYSAGNLESVETGVNILPDKNDQKRSKFYQFVK